MKVTIMQCKLWYVALCLLPYHIINAKVYPQPGENLWRLTARIGACVDAESTKLDWLESLTDNCQLLSNEALQNNDIGIENLGVINQLLNNRALNNTNGNYAGVSLVTTPTLTTSFWANSES